MSEYDYTKDPMLIASGYFAEPLDKPEGRLITQSQREEIARRVATIANKRTWIGKDEVLDIINEVLS